MRRTVAAVTACALAAMGCQSTRFKQIAGGIVTAGGVAMAVDGVYLVHEEGSMPSDDGGPGLLIVLGGVVTAIGAVMLIGAHHASQHDMEIAELMKPPAPPPAIVAPELHDLAMRAYLSAHGGDCAGARAAMSQLQDRDPAFARQHAAEPAIAACLVQH